MIIALDCGHTLNGFDYGSQGHLIESNETRNIGREFIKLANEKGHTVVNCTVDSATSVSNSLNARVNKERQSNADVFVSIHLNAGRGFGTEVYIAPNTAGMYANVASFKANEAIATKVAKEVSTALGIPNRGVKDDYFYVLTATKAKAILLEVCFVDSDDYKSYNANKVAKALLKALTGDIATDKPTTDNKPTPAPPNEEFKITEYVEGGKCTICVKEGVYFYNKPYISEITGSYEYKESVYYDYVVITNKYVYISWISAATGIRRYMPVKDKATGERWGNCV